MHQPPCRILLKITALTFALGAGGCYVWKAQEQPVRKHLPSTKSIDSLVAPPQKLRLSGTKSITQPVFSTRNQAGQSSLPPETVLPPSVFAPAPAPNKQPLDYPGYPPPAAVEVDTGGEIFTSTKSGVPLIKVQPSKP